MIVENWADNIALVLVRPRFAQNIGACCRAMHNMGLTRLILVAPENPMADDIDRMATQAARQVVAGIQTYPDLESALAPFQYVVGTTARRGKQRQLVETPRQMAAAVAPLATGNAVAIMFGPEDRGLDNAALKYCHRLVHIPTGEFSSLNLAQAVMIVCYEIFLATRQPEANAFVPRYAENFELEGMYAHLKQMLLQIDFINPDNPDYWMNNFRRFFARVGLTAKEVRLIRGICRQVNWFGQQQRALPPRPQSPDRDPDPFF